MTNRNYLFLFILVFSFFACRNQEAKAKKTTASPLDKSEGPPSAKEEVDAGKKEFPVKEVRYFVAAKSGLNYRKQPKGTVLGKWPLNTPVKVIERSGLIEEIKDGHQRIKGEWVGVQLEQEIVYVFDAFLSLSPVTLPEEPPPAEDIQISKYQNFGIYHLDTYEKSPGKSSGFIVLTDAFPWSQDPDSLSIANKHLGFEEIEDYHYLDPVFRARFLSRRQIAETDQVFIYTYSLDSIFTFPVRDLALLARINPYGAQAPIVDFDYMIGFDLGEKLKLKDAHLHYYNSFVFVGSENPFIQGQLQAIVWEKTADSSFPAVPPLRDIPKDIPKNISSATYKFDTDDYHYFLRMHGWINQLVVTSKDKEIVFNQTHQGSEGVSPAPLRFADKENEYPPEQWTGKLFKNKPPVIFGFLYESFSCTNIDLLGAQEHPIYIRCDCRH